MQEERITREEWLPELFNALTHGIAAIASIVGTIFLVQKALISIEYGLADLIGFIVYGFSLFGLFTASTLYHSFSFWRYQSVFRKIDHAFIYVLIAGSYTPYLITGIGGWFGYIMLALIWAIGIAGIFYEVFNAGKNTKLSTMLYLGMGWVSVIMIYPLFQNASVSAIIWLAIGGIMYSFGTLFYRKKDNPWMHVIWHLFVMAGALSMYVSIYFYL